MEKARDYMDEKGQVSFEYLLTVLFGVVLAFAAFAVAGYILNFAADAGTRIDAARSSAISSLMG